MIKYRPLAGNVVVKLLVEKVTPGGIVLPDCVTDNKDHRDGLRRAKVVRVGPGIRTENGVRVPNQTKPGDEVLIHHFAGVEVRDDKYVPHRVVTDDEIFAVVE